MTPLFADTFYYLALINPNDQFHLTARRFLEGNNQRIITTQFVLLEIVDALSSVRTRRLAFDLTETIRNDTMTWVSPLSPTILERALDLFHARPDKNWSLTDCTSFVTMADHELHSALTADAHFRQAGFHVLFDHPQG